MLLSLNVKANCREAEALEGEYGVASLLSAEPTRL